MLPERDRQDDCVGLECIPQRLATTVGPIARACGANASGGRRLATVTSMFLRAKAWAKAWPIVPNPTIAYFIMFSRSRVRTKFEKRGPAGQVRDCAEVRPAPFPHRRR